MKTIIRIEVAGKTVLLGALLLVFLGAASSLLAASPGQQTSSEERVAQSGENRYVLPVSQILTPAGKQVELPGLRPQVLALSPDGSLLVTSGKTHELVVVDPDSGKILQHVPFPPEPGVPSPDSASSHLLAPDEEGQVSYTGMVFSGDGSRMYVSNVNGSIKVFEVTDNQEITGLLSSPLTPTGLPRRQEAVPSGLRLSEDGRSLYVVLNLANRLLEIDTATHRQLRTFDVGVAPFDVVLLGSKAYVSNWGGRRPDGNSVTGPAGRGSEVKNRSP